MAVDRKGSVSGIAHGYRGSYGGPRGPSAFPNPACTGTPSLDGLWTLLQSCWEGNPEKRPAAVQLVERLMGPDIQATKTVSTEWDDIFTSRLRRHLMGHRPLPSVPEFERMIFSDGQAEGENRVEPEIPVNPNLQGNVDGFTFFLSPSHRFSPIRKIRPAEIPIGGTACTTAGWVRTGGGPVSSIHEMFPEHLMSARPVGSAVHESFPSYVVSAPPPIAQPSFPFNVLNNVAPANRTTAAAHTIGVLGLFAVGSPGRTNRWKLRRSRSSHSSTSSDGDGSEDVYMKDGGEVGEGQVGKKHVCPTCRKGFNRPAACASTPTRILVQLVSPPAPSFSSAPLLLRMIQRNTDTTPSTAFRCLHPNCGRAFNVNSNMRRHFRNHAAPVFSPTTSSSSASSESVLSPMAPMSSPTSPAYSYTPTFEVSPSFSPTSSFSSPVPPGNPDPGPDWVRFVPPTREQNSYPFSGPERGRIYDSPNVSPRRTPSPRSTPARGYMVYSQSDVCSERR
ncbi:hypothetical protein B0H13DRAFT_2412665 [Mycena leptocephala]|nr:hypothetical protein B0H13DRAFT_2412665 [Mycena leptocephala]